MAKEQIRPSDYIQNSDKFFDGFVKSGEKALELLDALEKSLEKTTKAGEDFGKNFDKDNAADIARLEKEVETLNKALEEQTKILRTKAKVQKEVDQEAKEREKILKREEQLRKRLNQVKGGELDETIKLQAEISKETSERRKNAKEALTQRNAYQQLTKEVNEAQAEFKELAARLGETSKEAKEARKRFEEADDRLRKINDAARDGRRDVGRYRLATQGLNKTFTGVAKAGGLLAGAIGVIASSVGRSRGALRELNLLFERLGNVLFVVGGRVVTTITKFILPNLEVLRLRFALIRAEAIVTAREIALAATFPGENRRARARAALNAARNQVASLNNQIDKARKNVKSLDEIWKGTTDAIKETNEQVSEVARNTDKLSDRTQVLQIDIEKLRAEQERLNELAGDNTISLNEQRAAQQQVLQVQAQRIQRERELAALQLQIAATQLDLNAKQSNVTDQLTKQQIDAINTINRLTKQSKDANGNLILSDADIKELDAAQDNLLTVLDDFEFADKLSQETLDAIANAAQNFETINESIRTELQANAQLERQIALDTADAQLDILIDGADRRKSLLEQQIQDENTTNAERLRLTDKLIADFADSFSKADEILSTAAGEPLNLNNFLDLTPEQINAELSKFDIPAQLIPQIRTFILDSLDFQRDLNDLQKENTETIKERAEITREASENTKDNINILTLRAKQEKEINDIIAGRELSELSTDELNKILELTEDFNKQQEENETSSNERRLVERLKVVNDEIDARKKANQDVTDLENEKTSLLLELARIENEEFNKAQEERTAKAQEEINKRIKSEEDAAQTQAELIAGTFDLIENLSEELSRRRLEQINAEIEATENRISSLEAQAQTGSQLVNDNIALEKKRLAELEQEKVRAEQQLAQIQTTLAIFRTFAANADQDPQTALTKTTSQVLSLSEFARSIVSTLPGFYEGTDDTGTSQIRDNYGTITGFTHDNEQVWSKKDRDAVGWRNRDEIKDIVGMYDKGILSQMTQPKLVEIDTSWNSNEEVLKKFDQLSKDIKELPAKMPKNYTDFDKLTGIVTETIKYGNKIEKRHKNVKNSRFRHG